MEFQPTMKDKNVMRLFFMVYLAFIIIFARQSILTKETWIYDHIISAVLLFVVYKARKKLNIAPFAFAFFAFALLLHNLGVYGFYTRSYLGLDFDHYTHFFGSMAVCMMLFNYFSRYNEMKLSTVALVSLFFTVGISGIHEIIEYLGYAYLGPGGGIFFAGDGDGLYTAADIGLSGTYSNAIIDILYNAVGSVAACIVMGLDRLRRK